MDEFRNSLRRPPGTRLAWLRGYARRVQDHPVWLVEQPRRTGHDSENLVTDCSCLISPTKAHALFVGLSFYVSIKRFLLTQDVSSFLAQMIGARVY